jgi:hypothetical protein
MGKGNPLENLASGLFSPDAIQDALALPQLPKAAVAKGAKWEEKKTVGSPIGKMSVGMKYTFEGEVEKNGKKLQKIAVVPSFSLKGESQDPKMPLKITIKGSKGKGHLYFDNEAGRFLESTSESTMDVEIGLGEVMLPTRVNQNTTLKLKRPGQKSK